MPSILSYVPGAGPASDAVDLESAALSGEGWRGLRGRSWSYDLGWRGISSPVRSAREVSATLVATDPDGLERARRVFDRDVMALAPGEIRHESGFSTRAYVVSSEPEVIFRGSYRARLTVVLVDGVWRRPHTESFPIHVPEGGAFLDLPYDLPYDLEQPGPVTSLEASGWYAAPVRLTVYGPVSSPELSIGGNAYRFDTEVPDGGYLVCDGLERTISVTAANGLVTDAFASGERGAGAGCGSYCFERVPAGTSEVSWDNSFGFDVTWYEEEGEPPWS